MKKILFMVIGFMFATQVAFASPTGDKMNFETLDKADAQMLFVDNDMASQEVRLISQKQMAESKAKGWFSRIRPSIGRPCWYICPPCYRPYRPIKIIRPIICYRR